MLALIDGDVLRYRVGFACQTTFYDVWEDWDGEQIQTRAFRLKKDLTEYIKGLEDGTYEVEERIEAEPVQNCLHSVKLQLNSILAGAKADRYKVLLSGKSNFREELVDYYKAHRDRDKRPVHYDAITQYLIERWDARMVNGREADDAMSILQWKNFDLPASGCIDHYAARNSTIICTIDKDLNMVPGWHYNFVNDETYWVDEVEGLRFFYGQMLEGDSADNIPGITKITGNRRPRGYMEQAKKDLAEMSNELDMWEYVKNCYLNEFCCMDPNEDTILTVDIETAIIEKLRETGKLLWMQRTTDDDWEPPQ